MHACMHACMHVCRMLKTIILDEYKLEPFEHASVINVVRLFDERYVLRIETNEKM